MRVSGTAFAVPAELRDNINTDVILPGAYLRLPEPELAPHAFAGLLPGFHEQVRGHAVLVAGRNMGCGSSREQAPKALLGCGVRAVVAHSFGLIFRRNAVNLGLAPVTVRDEADLDRLRTGEAVELELDAGVLRLGSGEAIAVHPLEPPVLRILGAGGLLPLLRADPDAFGAAAG